MGKIVMGGRRVKAIRFDCFLPNSIVYLPIKTDNYVSKLQ